MEVARASHHTGLREGPKQEIHIAGKRKGCQVSKSAKMKLIGIHRNPMDSSCGNFVNAGGRSRDRVGFSPCTVDPETGQTPYLGHVQFPPPSPLCAQDMEVARKSHHTGLRGPKTGNPSCTVGPETGQIPDLGRAILYPYFLAGWANFSPYLKSPKIVHFTY